MTDILTYSEIATFMSCRRKCRFRYFDQIVPEGQHSQAMYFGKIIHKALEEWNKTRNKHKALLVVALEYEKYPPEKFDPVEFALAESMIEGYIERYKDDDRTCYLIEREFRVPIINPATGRRSQTWEFAGKIDGLIETEDGTLILEHKTSSDSKRVYLERLWTDMQTILYAMAVRRQFNIRVQGVLYDVLHKTRAKTKLIERYRNPDMFQRETVMFDKDTFKSFQALLWNVTKEFNHCKRQNRWLPNPTACYSLYGMKCGYYPICRSNESPLVIENNYVHKEPHEELSIVTQRKNTKEVKPQR